MGRPNFPSTAINTNAAHNSRDFTTASLIRSARFTTDDPNEVIYESDNKMISKAPSTNRLRYSTDIKVSDN